MRPIDGRWPSHAPPRTPLSRLVHPAQRAVAQRLRALARPGRKGRRQSSAAHWLAADLRWSFSRNAHLDQRAVRPSRPQPVPEWCAAMRPDQWVTDGPLRRLCDKPPCALAALASLGRPAGLRLGPRHRTGGGSSRPIDLGGPICPMEPVVLVASRTRVRHTRARPTVTRHVTLHHVTIELTSDFCYFISNG